MAKSKRRRKGTRKRRVTIPTCTTCGQKHWNVEKCPARAPETAPPEAAPPPEPAAETKSEDAGKPPESSPAPEAAPPPEPAAETKSEDAGKAPESSPAPASPAPETAPPEAAAEPTSEAYKSKYAIVSSFNVGPISYNIGEPLPDGLSPQQVKELFDSGRIGRIEGGKIVAKKQYIEIHDSRIESIARASFQVIKSFIANPHIGPETLKRLQEKCTLFGNSDEAITLIAAEIEKRG